MIFVSCLLMGVWVNLLRFKIIHIVNLLWNSLSTLHVEVTSGPRCQEGYILFYLNREFYELNSSAFNSIFHFPPSLDLNQQHVLGEFNHNAFWYTLTSNYHYDASHSKGTIIRNPCIRVAQHVLACGLFA